MSQPIRKVLIANRGEIACRVIAACRDLGVASVAVYSEADRNALHRRLADEAVEIGPPEAASSYLDIERLLAAAAATGATDLHPGYGFRAESAELVEACEAKGIRFIGPSAQSLRIMADKRTARSLAREAGVPTVPGYEGELDTVAEGARKLGFPVLVKAALGGGGKGMQVVRDEEGLAEALESAARLAASSFGDASVYLERCIENARHIEVQILGDGKGHAIHLGERECSLQRRHQKVIEETPSPAVDDDLRRSICDAAVALAKKANYLSTGTVEFLLTDEGQFYFLEMNTRIQVEHPVTEEVTGFDLVVAQLEIAAGGALPEQSEIVSRGHAVEARITAEDVVQGFLPQAGELLRFDLPDRPWLRVDSGVVSGSVVPIHYDSLLAKLIAWGRDRDEAWRRLRHALDDTVIHGVQTNLPLLRDLTRDEGVLAGEMSTTMVEDRILATTLTREKKRASNLLIAAAAIAEGGQQQSPTGTGKRQSAGDVSPFRRLGRFRLGTGA